MDFYRDNFLQQILYKDKNLLNRLSSKERQVIEMSFGIGVREMSLSEISEVLGVGPERCRQIKKSAINKLR